MLLYFDGDDVGNVLELQLLENCLDVAIEHSERVSRAIEDLRNRLEADFGAEILFAAGDEVLAHVDYGSFSNNRIEELRENFAAQTGCTLSAGVGGTPSDATLNLRRAKLAGKNRTVGSSTDNPRPV